MTVKCPAKINLSLDVVNRRSDGYHNLKTVMHTVDIFDELTVSAEKSDKNNLSLKITGLDLAADDSNLCIKAAKAFLDFAELNAKVDMTLTKNIPMGAGLGGGSSDAAGVIIALNKLLDTKLSDDKLISIAKSIGADVPFFIKGGCQLCEGIGEILTHVNSALSAYLLVAKPDFGVSTPLAYKNLKLTEDTHHPDTEQIIKAIENGNLEALSKASANLLENAVLPLYPEISEYKSLMLNHGAEFSLMSGSGSAVFGLFKDKITAEKAFTAFKTNQIYLCALK